MDGCASDRVVGKIMGRLVWGRVAAIVLCTIVQ